VAAGSNWQVQFNDGGAFGGDAGLTYDKTTDTLTVAGGFSAGGDTQGSQGTIAAAPAGGHSTFASKSGAHAAYIGFNRWGSFAAVLGIDTDNQWKVGGWSMGAASYVILHEANSFTISPTALTTTKNVNVAGLTASGSVNATNVIAGPGDVYANRGTNTGVFLAGSDGTSYLQNDGSKFLLVGRNLTAVGSVAINTYDAPSIPFQVATAADWSLGMSAYGGMGYWGAFNSAFSVNREFLLHGPALGPLFDNSTYCGTLSNRLSFF
jgi:hypothetical protein